MLLGKLRFKQWEVSLQRLTMQIAFHGSVEWGTRCITFQAINVGYRPDHFLSKRFAKAVLCGINQIQLKLISGFNSLSIMRQALSSRRRELYVFSSYVPCINRLLNLPSAWP